MLSLIVATDLDGCIGLNNTLPWHLPADLAYFKKTTSGHTIIMGRKTFDSIGRPLPNRKNIVLTTDKSWEREGVTVVHSIEEILDQYVEVEEEIFIIGGSQIFDLVLPYAKRTYLTLIKESFKGDTFFSPLKENEWKVVSSEKGTIDEKNVYEHEFLVYEKK